MDKNKQFNVVGFFIHTFKLKLLSILKVSNDPSQTFAHKICFRCSD